MAFIMLNIPSLCSSENSFSVLRHLSEKTALKSRIPDYNPLGNSLMAVLALTAFTSLSLSRPFNQQSKNWQILNYSDEKAVEKQKTGIFWQ